MPRPIPTQQYEVVLNLVARHPEGLAIEQIDASLHGVATKRTLQRWLSDLILQGYLRRVRAGRGTRYRLATFVTAAGNVKPKVRTTGPGGLWVPLTAEAESVQAHCSHRWTGRSE